MRQFFLRLAMLAVVCSVVAPGAVRAEDLAIRNCNWCHGSAAQGYTPAPRLAGQRSQYIENQLVSFHARTRDNPFSRQYMWGAAASLSPRMVQNLATYYAELAPRAANDGDRRLVELGRTIYQQGAPDSNIVACVACHGPDAEGVREIPRLGGLAYTYLKRRLQQWGQGYHSALRLPMPDIAQKLSPDQIEAVASYLSFVK